MRAGAAWRLAAFMGAASAALACGMAAEPPALRSVPVVVEHATGNFGTLWVVDEGGLRHLRAGAFDGPDQTVISLADPARLVMPYLRPVALAIAARPPPGRILLIGLGGGGIVHYLRRVHPQAAIDAVEIDPVVVTLARRHFGVIPDGRLVVHRADGARFVERPSVASTFDVAFLDAYDGDRIPPPLATPAFLTRLRETLRPDGIAAANVGVHGREAFVEAFVEVFPDCVSLRARQDDNLVLVGGRGSGSAPADVEEIARALDASGEWPFRFETIARTLRPCTGGRIRSPQPQALVSGVTRQALGLAGSGGVGGGAIRAGHASRPPRPTRGAPRATASGGEAPERLSHPRWRYGSSPMQISPSSLVH